jgi:hypothetical protein
MACMLLTEQQHAAWPNNSYVQLTSQHADANYVCRREERLRTWPMKNITYKEACTELPRSALVSAGHASISKQLLICHRACKPVTCHAATPEKDNTSAEEKQESIWEDDLK